MGMPETLYKLVTAAGPSGYEQAPAAVAHNAMPTSSYAPVSAPAAAWNGIRVRGVY